MITMGFEEDEVDVVSMDGDMVESLANKINKACKKQKIYNPKLIVPMELRQIFYSFLSLYVKNLTVLAFEEVSCNYKIDSLGEI